MATGGLTIGVGVDVRTGARRIRRPGDFAARRGDPPPRRADPVIRASRSEGRLTLALDRPEKANAMGEAFWRDLPLILDELDATPEIRAVVISGEGKHFTSGIDLSMLAGTTDLAKADPARAAYKLRKDILRLQDTFTAMQRARFPVICAIHGACVGGGIDMVTAADIRLASRDAYFAVEEINVGMAAVATPKVAARSRTNKESRTASTSGTPPATPLAAVRMAAA